MSSLFGPIQSTDDDSTTLVGGTNINIVEDQAENTSTVNVDSTLLNQSLHTPTITGTSGNATRLYIKDKNLSPLNVMLINAPILSQAITVTLPSATGTLALTGESVNRSQLTGAIGLIAAQDTSNRGIRFDHYGGSDYTTGLSITPKRLVHGDGSQQNYIQIDTPLITGATDVSLRFFLQGFSHSGSSLNYHRIHVPNITADTDITLPSSSGTLALTSQLPTGTNWTLSSSLLYPLSTSTNVLIGTTSSVGSYKLQVSGNMYLTGSVVMNNGDLANIREAVFKDGSNTYGVRLKAPTTGGFITVTLPSTTGTLLHVDSTATLGPGYTWNGAVIGSNKLDISIKDGTSLLFYESVSNGSNYVGITPPQNIPTNYFLTLPSTSGTFALDTDIQTLTTSVSTLTTELATNTTVKNDFGTGSQVGARTFGSSVQETNLTGANVNINSSNASNSCKIALNGQSIVFSVNSFEHMSIDANVVHIVDNQLNLENDNIYEGTAVPTNGTVCLNLTTNQGSTSNNNKYVSKARFNGAGNTGDANFTNWVYYLSSTSREFYGFSYWSGVAGAVAVDIYSLEKDGDLNIAGTLSSSDSRIKKNIVNADLDECIDVLKSIHLKKYNYTDDYRATYNKTTQAVFGFLADDIMDNEYISYCGKTAGMPKKLNNQDGTLNRTIEDFKTIKKPEILSVLWGVCAKQQEEIDMLKQLLVKHNIS